MGNTENQEEKPVQTELFETESGDPIIVRYVESRAVAEKLSKSEDGVGLVKVTKDTDLVKIYSTSFTSLFCNAVDSIS
jgi:hypothetical protein